MKVKNKIIIITAVSLCAVFAAYACYIHFHNPSINFDRLQKMYDSDKVVAHIDDEEITWERYFNVYAGYAKQLEYYMTQMKTYYDIETSWDDIAAEDGSTYAMQPRIYAENLLKQSAALSEFASRNLSVYNPENTDSVSNLIKDVYGVNGEKLSEKEVIEWMKNEGYVHAKHILFMTSDRNTGEKIAEDEILEKEKVAKQIYIDLSTIDNKDELITRFNEYCETYNEDPGETVLINGYTFLYESMYEEFSSAAFSLEEYQISEPVVTDAGIHIILRLPLDPNENLFESYVNGDETTTARIAFSYEKFDNEVMKIYKTKEINYEKDFKIPEIKSFIK